MIERRKRYFKAVLILIVLLIVFLVIGFRFLDQAHEKEKRIFYNYKIADGEVVEKKGFFIEPITMWTVHHVDLSREDVKNDNLVSKAIKVTYSGKKPKPGYYNFTKDDGNTWWYIGGEDKAVARGDKALIENLKGSVNDGYAYLYKTTPFISLFNTTWYIIPRGTTDAYPVCRDDGSRIYTPTGDDKLNEQVAKNLTSGNAVDETLFGVPAVSDKANKNK